MKEKILKEAKNLTKEETKELTERLKNYFNEVVITNPQNIIPNMKSYLNME